MTKEELYRLVDIDGPEDFSYFEQFADLVESDEEIEGELVKEVLSLIGSEDASSITENYFEDLMNSLPDDADDLVALVDSIKQNLLMCAENIEEPANRKNFAELVISVREWLHRENGAFVDGVSTTLFNAVAEHRAENVGGSSHRYDFSMSCDFDLDNMSLNLGAYEKVDILADENDNNSGKQYN